MVILKKSIHIISYIVYAFIGIYAIICLPIIAKYNPIVVLTGSMEPTYKVGSITYYKKVDINSLKKGDVITFLNKNKNVVSHRIVKIEKEEVEVKGDANKISDLYKVNKKDILGKDLNFSIPLLGYYIHFINKNWIICILFIIVILGLEFILSNMEINLGGNYEKNN